MSTLAPFQLKTLLKNALASWDFNYPLVADSFNTLRTALLTSDDAYKPAINLWHHEVIPKLENMLVIRLNELTAYLESKRLSVKPPLECIQQIAWILRTINKATGHDSAFEALKEPLQKSADKLKLLSKHETKGALEEGYSSLPDITNLLEEIAYACPQWSEIHTTIYDAKTYQRAILDGLSPQTTTEAVNSLCSEVKEFKQSIINAEKEFITEQQTFKQIDATWMKDLKQREARQAKLLQNIPIQKVASTFFAAPSGESKIATYPSKTLDR